MKYRLAIFDMDGTVLNTLDDLACSLNYALEKCGLPLRSTEEVKGYLGNGARITAEKGVPDGTDAETIDEVYKYFTEHYKTHNKIKTAPYPGIPELIKKLKDHQVLTAVVSNKSDYAVQELCKDFFPGLFDVAVGSREGMRKKPAPDSVNNIISELNIPKNEVIYIGDSDVDFKTAANAQIGCISVTWGFRSPDFLKSIGANNIVSTTDEVYEAIVNPK